jgi:hypothetical protein
MLHAMETLLGRGQNLNLNISALRLRNPNALAAYTACPARPGPFLADNPFNQSEV